MRRRKKTKAEKEALFEQNREYLGQIEERMADPEEVTIETIWSDGKITEVREVIRT